MTVLLDRPATAVTTQPELRWAAADDGFWVADDAGAFAGTVDQHGRHFFVRNGFGEYLGDYRTLRAAQTALAEHARRARASSC
ncbi:MULTISPECIES: hypothetical protein [unclassified Curtobacterium]|uniref:hypothetical protein n=1 Tax=unclassified Curtobacterium TaxID=257496 RepID=UPI000DA71E7F|nr:MULTISPECIES: hypothetical protein [unclassified Curtobacterium]PZE66516.1 hypothetical protein DEI83_07940 [Curtobacterium sp. MCBD17_021]WIB27386.1 hypothetical protein DEJ18_04625 [Curtobacterium sp. MCSS17_015]